MITRDELEGLLVELESDRVERTVSTTKTDKFSEAVCAFANDLPGHGQPGYLIIGVDEAGHRVGLTVRDELLQALGALRSGGTILPLPAITVGKFTFPDGDVAVVEVQPSDLPPVRYKGRICIRVGPRRDVASEQEERILSERRASRLTSFDSSPVVGSTTQDLALGLFGGYRHLLVSADVIANNHRTIEEQLASLRLFDLRRGCPTAAGLLLFGTNPRHFFPGAYVQFLRITGTSITDRAADQAEVQGDLQAVVRELEARMRAANHVEMRRVSAFQEELAPDYPHVAIQQVLLNAIMHRDYQSNTPVRFYWYTDRIEIQSPGGLYGEVTPETIDRRSSYRNPVIAEAMKAFGFVNRFGLGIRLAQELMARDGHPPIEFEIDERVVLAVLRR